MEVVYALEEAPETYSKSIFLAGPTPRDSETESWRPEAIRLLEEMGYNGVVFLPEDRDGTFHGNYMHQVEWELVNLQRADLIVFWIPRELEKMPAFTTNIEFGRFCESGRIIMGRPDDAVKMKYPDYVYQKITGQEPMTTLRDTLIVANNILAQGIPRTGSEQKIPLCVYYNVGFEEWMKRMTTGDGAAKVADAKVDWISPTNGKWPAERFAIEITWENEDGQVPRRYVFLDQKADLFVYYVEADHEE